MPSGKVGGLDKGMSAEKLGVALVGCGAISRLNAEAVQEARSARLSYCVDVDRAAAERLGKMYSVPGTDQLDEALASSAVDAVFVCTPHYFHAPLVERAARAGKHVIVEKPMGTSLADSRAIVEVCGEAGVNLGVCYCMRYGSKIEFVKNYIGDGGLGDIIGFEITMLRDRSEKCLERDTWQEGNPNWHCVKAKSGGGIFIDNISHYIDYFLYLTGMNVEEVYCRAGTFVIPADVEDNLWAILKAESGAVGTIAVGSAVRGAGQELDGRTANSIQRIWGSYGQVILIPELRVFSLRRIGGMVPNRWHAIKPRAIYNSGGSGVRERTGFVQNFARSVLEGREPDITGNDGLRVMEIIDAAYRSSREGRVAIIAGEKSAGGGVIDSGESKSR